MTFCLEKQSGADAKELTELSRLRRGIFCRTRPHSFSSQAASVVPFYCTLPAEFSRTTLESTAVSDLSGKCEQKPMPTKKGPSKCRSIGGPSCCIGSPCRLIKIARESPRF